MINYTMIPTGKYNVVEIWNYQESEIVQTFDSRGLAEAYMRESNLPKFDGFEGFEIQEDLEMESNEQK